VLECPGRRSVNLTEGISHAGVHAGLALRRSVTGPCSGAWIGARHDHPRNQPEPLQPAGSHDH
jgi:hypothetical protein